MQWHFQAKKASRAMAIGQGDLVSALTFVRHASSIWVVYEDFLGEALAFGLYFCWCGPTYGPPDFEVLIYRLFTEQPLEGRVRFEWVVRTDASNHARLSWCAYLLTLYFTGDLPELPSGRAGANRNI
eukprot:1076317-Pleurochrysis_carterae.AAC.5